MSRPNRILIDKLMDYWPAWDKHEKFYLKQFVPILVEHPALGDQFEQALLQQIRRGLSHEEWKTLPTLMRTRRQERRRLDKRRSRRPQASSSKSVCVSIARIETLVTAFQRARSECAAQDAQRQERLLALQQCLRHDFLSADAFYASTCASLISPDQYAREKISFVRTWAQQTTGTELDAEQAAAVGSVRGHLHVSARAGSGKTTTIVHRALFLQQHCRVAPNDMLLLAFNRTAADTMAARLRTMCEGSRPHVMTFHQLAYARVRPPERLLDSQDLSRAVQHVIDDHLQIPDCRAQIRELMLAHFREDWESIVAGGHDKDEAALLQLHGALPRESLGGEYVKSFGEKVIADFLFEHAIPYKYERNHWWGKMNYRPDFTIFKTNQSGVIIEYFGLAGDPEYDALSQKKRRYWEHKPGWVLVECYPHDLTAGGAAQLRARLQAALEVHDIPCNRLSEEVIWHRVRSRAIDRFTTAMVGFIGRCRKRTLDPQQLDALVARHTPLAPVERMFLKLATQLYRAYLGRLRVREEEDFDGLMQRAVETVARGHTVFERTSGQGDLRTLRYVFIDEFQDFSELFYRLIVALRQQNTRAEFCCVGDDWQAINGFAGSDLQFYEHFDKYFEDAQRLSLSTNYRSSRAIVGVSNALMHGRGSPAVAHKTAGSQVLLADLATFEPTLREKEQYPGDILTPSILRLARKALTTGHDVVLLCRRHGLPWYVHDQEQGATSHRGLERYLNVVRSSLPAEFRERITISTVHQYKGMEKAMVFVLDAVVCSYPLLHADWVFTRILGDNLEKLLEEERRVFYVALTRAVNTLVIFTEHGNASPFLDDIQRVQPIPAIHWPDFPPMPGTMRCMVVQVGNQEGKGSEPTLAIREGLKAEGFQWQSRASWPHWAKSYPAESFNIGVLQTAPWAAGADGVEVRICDDGNVSITRYRVDLGTWCCCEKTMRA